MTPPWLPSWEVKRWLIDNSIKSKHTVIRQMRVNDLYVEYYRVYFKMLRVSESKKKYAQHYTLF